ncbi:hypothetical protein F4774DRAFT_281798 [Daldinia eschscholtzii]|nr:hypothetical protein F4774DRAFT_281798 [Daldinia eschscholtzii]
MPTCELCRPPNRIPYVQLLRTCKQVNSEATPVLYGKNKFLVGIPHLTRFYPMNFFLWSLRHSTMSSLSSITFVRACRGNCSEWVKACATTKNRFLCIKEWATTGPQLVKLCFPHYGEPHWLPLSRTIREVEAHVRRRIFQDESAEIEGYTCFKHRGKTARRSDGKKELTPMRF